MVKGIFDRNVDRNDKKSQYGDERQSSQGDRQQRFGGNRRQHAHNAQCADNSEYGNKQQQN